MPKFLTPREAASILRISTTYCRDLIRQGRIPATKPTGKAILIDESDLMHFIQAGKTSAPASVSDPEVKA